MGFMDKAKKMAEQAQTKLDEVQKGFNEGQGSQGSSQRDGWGSGPVRQARPPGAARGRRAAGALGSARPAGPAARRPAGRERASGRLRPLPRAPRRPRRPRPPPGASRTAARPRRTARTSTRRRRSPPGTPWRADDAPIRVILRGHG